MASKVATAKLAETVYLWEQGAHNQLLQLTVVKTQTLRVRPDDYSAILDKFHVDCANHDN